MSTENSNVSPIAKVRPPADWLAGLREGWVSDLISGFIVFLVALPLSVGIALASGAPPSAGLLAAIVGGIFGALLGGSYLTINGPAAGLIVIVLGAVQDLGQGDPQAGFRRALAAFFVAGLIQIAFGVLRLGVLGLAVPTSVIHGMLTAIGAIIIVKQIPVALGIQLHSKEILEMAAEIPKNFPNLNTEVALIAAVGFIIILGFKLFKGGWTKYVPAPLVVVVAGVAMARLFDFDHEHLVTSHWQSFTIGPKLLLTLPENLAKAIIFPDFSQIFTLTSLRWTISLALVGSIESLLTAAAVDRLDPYRRTSGLDRELISKGICNTICGLIGALPIIAEIVRSSANVRNGAKTRWANFFHGAFLLAFLIALPGLLHMIPLAALAAILISVGYVLAHPSQFLHTAEVGKDHFAAFLTTFVVTVASDLLVGVAAGILVEIIFNVARGTTFKNLFRLAMTEEKAGDTMRIQVKSALVFSNFLSLKRCLETTDAKKVVVDLSASPLVDHTVLDQLTRYQSGQEEKGRAIQLSFSDSHSPVSRHPLAARRLHAVPPVPARRVR